MFYFIRSSVVLQSLLLINQEEGINGLYAGIVPRLLAGLGTVVLMNVAKHAFTRYLFDPSPMTAHISDFVASVIYIFLFNFLLIYLKSSMPSIVCIVDIYI